MSLSAVESSLLANCTNCSYFTAGEAVGDWVSGLVVMVLDFRFSWAWSFFACIFSSFSFCNKRVYSSCFSYFYFCSNFSYSFYSLTSSGWSRSHSSSKRVFFLATSGCPSRVWYIETISSVCISYFYSGDKSLSGYNSSTLKGESALASVITCV